MMKSLAADMGISIARPAAGPRVRAEPEASARGETWFGDSAAFSPADPDTLARAVRAHKAGDAFAQAALTIALMLAIGVVAFVLSSGHAAAAGFLVEGVADHAATVGAVAVAAGVLLLGMGATVRMTAQAVRVRARKPGGR
ncbi:hypothetical protein [Xanthobacter agilis]|uniref:Protein-S-isoprenylcysteine O-methyltransferase Ste14 n=1 Tax=Xanthobacter agilis TaxID=47492 RepID=A0ABU0LCK9_XANAG|nr:hypothetical protein [Xanthobacter agilis]MDQ0504827.1 protein-S-isoprenylcysteine O-methyltransferase Ste14 [Xanthobacter agilis]